MKYIQCSFTYKDWEDELKKGLGYVVNNEAKGKDILDKWKWEFDEKTIRFIENSNKHDIHFYYEVVDTYTISEINPQGYHERSQESNIIQTTLPSDIYIDWDFILTKTGKFNTNNLNVSLILYKNITGILKPVSVIRKYDRDFIKKELGLTRYNNIPLSFNIKENSSLEDYFLKISDIKESRGGFSVEWNLNELRRNSR